MDVAMPIWNAEQYLFAAWNWLTGFGRLALRRVFLAMGLMSGVIGCFLMQGWLWKGVMVTLGTGLILVRWYGWDHNTHDHKNPGHVHRAAVLLYSDVVFSVHYLSSWSSVGPFLHALGFLTLTDAIIGFADFILWADKMDNGRTKQRETLPEKLAKLFAVFSPRAAQG